MDDSSKAFLGRGWKFPMSVEAQRGGIASVHYEQDIQESIEIILGTAKGERVMRSDFGCGIHNLAFAVINSSLVTQIEQSVREALNEYERRISVEGISVDTSDTINGRLLILIEYMIRATNQPGNLVYPFYFKEAF